MDPASQFLFAFTWGPGQLTWTRLPQDTLVWEEEAYSSFERLKRELRSAPALGLPDYRIPFNLFIHEQMGVASGVLTQPFRDQERPVAYYSLQLDNTAKGAVSCLRAIAAAAVLLEKAQETVLVERLLTAIHLPAAIAVVHCKAHTKGRDSVSKETDVPTKAAQMAALRIPNNESEFQSPPTTSRPRSHRNLQICPRG
uniref:Reverse transcriptase/retrotransposon-derived protein RNase H-like domain-containing protein n=1 Tax=Podarcis muralis TaxID=64176 RepID=A0A670KEY5_PODMU